MNIFVYSDESGVFDKIHNDYFVFGGLIFLSKENRDIWSRKYTTAENAIRKSENVNKKFEIKAATVSNKSKSKLYRSLNKAEKFGVVVSQKKLGDTLFENKKCKQRYLDWAYKMAVKRKFKDLISKKQINPREVEGLFFFVDEHTTATDGRYELKESLEQEFKIGTYSTNWLTFHPPIFKNLKTVEVKYCNSAKKRLIRAADIVANRIYNTAIHNDGFVEKNSRLTMYYHPDNSN